MYLPGHYEAILHATNYKVKKKRSKSPYTFFLFGFFFVGNKFRNSEYNILVYIPI